MRRNKSPLLSRMKGDIVRNPSGILKVAYIIMDYILPDSAGAALAQVDYSHLYEIEVCTSPSNNIKKKSRNVGPRNHGHADL